MRGSADHMQEVAADFTSELSNAEVLEEALADVHYAPGVVSTFISDGDFWYVTRDHGEYTYWTVSRDGSNEPLLTESLRQALPGPLSAAISDAQGLLPGLVVFPSTITFWAGGRRWLINRGDGSLEWMPEATISREVSWAPDGTKFIYLDEEGTFIANVTERAVLKIDAHGRTGTLGSAPRVSVEETQRRSLGIIGHKPAVLWSPDSRLVATHFTDESHLNNLTLLDSSGGSERDAVVVKKPRIYPGDPEVTKCELVLIQAGSGRIIPVGLPTQLFSYASPFSTDAAWWGSGKEDVLYLTLNDRLKRTQTLWRITRDGNVALLITDPSTTRAEGSQWYYDHQIPVWTSSDGHTCLWPSQREGWVDLYKFDLTRLSSLGADAIPHKVTSGHMNVRRILHVDEQRNSAVLVVEGLEPSNPYLRQIVTVDLASGSMERLTQDQLDHDARAHTANETDFFIDISSRYDRVPRVTVRRWAGTDIFTLPVFDERRLTRAGWIPPELVNRDVADGTTLYGLLYKPTVASAESPVPMIDYLYPGPQVSRVPYSFSYSIPVIEIFGKANTLCALGFAVLLLDSRGTPGRSKQFHDFAFLDSSWAGAASDHKEFVVDIARREWVDSQRIGAIGLSGGGFATARLLALYPDIYRYGVSISGNHDNANYHDYWLEEYYGPNPSAWKQATNVLSPDLPRGQLLLIHGEMDDNVQPTNMLRLVSRMMEAGAPLDMLYVPGADHSFTNRRDYVRRHCWRYLLRYAFDANICLDGLSIAATYDPLVDWTNCLA